MAAGVIEVGPGECSQEAVWKLLLEMSSNKTVVRGFGIRFCYVTQADPPPPSQTRTILLPPSLGQLRLRCALLCLLISFINENSSAGYGGASFNPSTHRGRGRGITGILRPAWSKRESQDC